MNNLEEMKSLIKQLNEASTAYYKYDKPIMSDKDYDALYDRLEQLEKGTSIIMVNSPTQKVQGEILEGLTKVKHSKPMLSANKTKDINEVKRFVGNQLCVEMWKLDGLTIVIRYENGLYKQAITRGGGDTGEDVTHTIRHCINLPLKLRTDVNIEVRGECVISWENFDKINETLEEPYSHPRNLAAGSVRQLDSNVAKERYLEFIAFELVQDNNIEKLDTDVSLGWLSDLGFQVTEREFVQNGVANVEDVDLKFNPINYKYPVDGTIYKYEFYDYGESLGTTVHHPLNMIARKWKDDTYETTLVDIEWNTSRTGLINPVAIFSPVDLGGAITTRATLHNISYMEDLQLGIGDTITVYRANMVIPKVDDNLTKSNTFKIPDKCPECGSDIEVKNDNGSKFLYCTNPNCKAKLISRLTHFVSKYAMNIDGMSEATIEKFVELGWLNELVDIYNLKQHRNKMITLDGFGVKSGDKLLAAIEESKHVKLENFIYSLSIPLIGKTASKTISKYCKGDTINFYRLINEDFDFTNLDDFGGTMHESIANWFRNNYEIYRSLATIMNFVIEDKANNNTQNSKSLDGMTFVITGSVNRYKNREELKADIESRNGKVAGSVSKSTSYLINNDNTSTSGKNKKAQELGIKIITEDEFLEMIK
ncbi:MAG: ligase LigA [Clostridiaceae bacterium]|jgi:DNA ligase (NAD+)|nr:ligase LigA [Clostridiaceae bacterium]MDF2950483.1 ligase LigA [Anaerocolumna sp.]